MRKIIAAFSKNHLFVNLMVLAVFAISFGVWNLIQKEDMPEVAIDQVFIMVQYEGATPSEVEHFVTEAIEESLEGVQGIKRIQSSSMTGFSRIYIDIDNIHYDPDDILLSIKEAVNGVRFPEEMTKEPSIRSYKASQKSILEFYLYNKEKILLDVEDRQEIQDAVDALQIQLASLPSINEVTVSDYHKEKVEIVLNAEKLAQYDLSFSKVKTAITRENLRQPIGIIEEQDNAKMTLNSELDDIEKIKNVIVRSSFSGPLVRLKDIAEIKEDFGEERMLMKVNGHQAIGMQIRKNIDSGIVEASDEVQKVLKEFFETRHKEGNLDYLITHDTAESVRNRLNLVLSNGLLGFFIIFLLLFLLLNFKSGFWVGMGIPFALSLGLISIYLMGYSINNMTLAGVIVVLGMLSGHAV